jgi:serine/threonine protein kinase/WD40 repeat protein
MRDRDLFIEALQKPDTAARRAFLDAACAGDSALRDRVLRLLAEHEKQESFLLDAPPGVASLTVDVPPSERPGAMIGPYKLLEPIGEGGMGSVWLAQQAEPVKRRVALKLIKPGMDSKQVLARFEAERQALALMDHPNIARILDGGLTPDGRPFFVMELVKGVPITQYCDANKLTPRQRLELFVPVCQAVQHAHQKAVIHRDLKPSNVLVALYDDRPVPKVIDFGVAKAIGGALTEQTIETGLGGVVGTPEYMSPEQATLNNLDIDTRSDVYALGVLLYELLTGSPPFSKKELEQKGLLEMLRVVREEEPPKPSTKLSTADALPTLSANRGTEPKKLAALLRSELDWIVLKALEKDRSRRYETANGFAADINRYLAGEPVVAHPPSAGYRLRKFARRNRVAMRSAALVFCILIGAVVLLALSNLQTLYEKHQKVIALEDLKKKEEDAQLRLFRALVAEARNGRLSNGLGRRIRSLQVLEEATRLARELNLPPDDFLELRNETIACLPLIDLHVAKEWPGYPADATGVDFDSNLNRYVRLDLNDNASVRRVADDVEICHVTGELTTRDPVLSPDGRFLILHKWTGIKVWRVDNEQPTLLCKEDLATGIGAFSPDGKQFALSRPDGTVRVYDLPSGDLVKKLNTPPYPKFKAFNGAKRQLAVGHSKGISVIDLVSEKRVQEIPVSVNETIQWSSDGVTLAAEDTDVSISLWNVPTGKLCWRLVGHTGGFARPAFNPVGDLCASFAFDNRLFLWDPRTGQQLLRTPWDTPGLWPRIGKNNNLFGADIRGHHLRLWELVPAVGYRTLVRDPSFGKGNYHTCAFSSKHRLLACSMPDGISLFEVPSGRFVSNVSRAWKNDVAFEPMGSLLGNSSAGQARWGIEETGESGTLHVGEPNPLAFPRSPYQIA